MTDITIPPESLKDPAMVLMPREPTPQMLWAGEGITDLVLPDTAFENTVENRRSEIRTAYYAMIETWERERTALSPAPPAPSPWRPIETAPRDGSRMLLAYRTSLGKWRRVIAFYASKFAVEQDDYNSDWCDYDEAGDRYFLPEGWYECIENWDDYSSVHMSGVEPTHWTPLPPAPGKEEA